MHLSTPSNRRSDRGFTFIEVLVSVVLLGTAGIAVLAALGAAATGAAVNRSVSDVQAALANAGDAISDVDSPYLGCDVNADEAIEQAYISHVRADSPEVTAVEVSYWTGASWDPSGCSLDAGHRLQRVTLAAESSNASETLVVVKRPATDPTVGIEPPSPSGGGAGDGSATIEPNPDL